MAPLARALGEPAAGLLDASGRAVVGDQGGYSASVELSTRLPCCGSSRQPRGSEKLLGALVLVGLLEHDREAKGEGVRKLACERPETSGALPSEEVEPR